MGYPLFSLSVSSPPCHPPLVCASLRLPRISIATGISAYSSTIPDLCASAVLHRALHILYYFECLSCVSVSVRLSLLSVLLFITFVMLFCVLGSICYRNFICVVVISEGTLLCTRHLLLVSKKAH